MEPTRSLTVQVTGARAATTVPTWGQWAIWRWHGMVDEDAHFNNGERHEIPVGCGLEQVVDAIGYVLHRHDALRTVFRTEDGELRQVVESAGTVTVDVYDTTVAEAETVAETVKGQLSALAWNGRQWPTRMALVVADQTPVWLVLAYNRLVLDAASADIVKDDVMKACTGEASELPPRWQPVEQAYYEQSPEGAAANEQALEHWRRILADAPRSMFDYPARTPERMRYGYVHFESPAMARAVWMMRKRWRIPSAALLVAAMAVVLSQYSGRAEIVMQLLAANRGDRNRRQMVGTLTALGLLHVDLHESSFEQVARKTLRAFSVANQSAFYDSTAVGALLKDMRLRRGAYLDLAIYFNDLRSAADIGDPEPEMTEQELHELAGTAWQSRDTSSPDAPVYVGPVLRHEMETSPTLADARFFLVTTHGRHLPLLLFGDTKYFSREALRELLCGMERLLVAAACGAADSADLAQITGVTPVSRDGAWVRCGDGWVDRAATAELWREVTGTEPSREVTGTGHSREVTGTGHSMVGVADGELVGYVAGGTEPSFTELHRAFVAALGLRNDVRAPDRYRWVAHPPTNPADPSAWQQVPVLLEADGRPAPGGETSVSRKVEPVSRNVETPAAKS